jgi:hypothetical protein
MNTIDFIAMLANRLIEQGGRSLDETGYCRYRGVNGAKCIIGHMIDDSVYDEKLEGKSIGSITRSANKFIEVLSNVYSKCPDDMPLSCFKESLESLQDFHDRELMYTTSVTDVKIRLAEIFSGWRYAKGRNV